MTNNNLYNFENFNFADEFNLLPDEIKIMLIKYFYANYYDDFEEFYNEHCKYDDYYSKIDELLKIRIEKLICYRNKKKEEVIDEFMSSVNKMKELFIEPPDEFNLTYHVQYFADRRGSGHIINPYLSKDVAENISTMEHQDWVGKYGRTVRSFINNSNDDRYLKLDCDGKSPNRPYGIALQDNTYY